MKYLIHLKTGNRIITTEEAIQNAKEQEREGVEPHYRHFALEKRGWLIWSTFEDGTGIIVKSKDNYRLIRGFQGDFTYC